MITLAGSLHPKKDSRRNEFDVGFVGIVDQSGIRRIRGPDRCAGRWYPDTESLKQIGGVVMYPDPSTGSAPIPVNRVYTPEGEVLEKNVRNVMLNFGPQHPAAHGVLRLVLELDAEVCSTGDFLPARIGNTLKIAAGVS
ncbi:unnamed protein product [Nesidiocoris tenuis]|uniref:NADH-ubiquinone oxidoreductase 49 kDa subunit n=1 Tax=Nesidiocoris tenuis TaxID=355587 RepID=A0A6H5GE69_9HEMI|nr:unnamed protein product [Nesidiocoris tenuis]